MPTASLALPAPRELLQAVCSTVPSNVLPNHLPFLPSTLAAARSVQQHRRQLGPVSLTSLALSSTTYGSVFPTGVYTA